MSWALGIASYLVIWWTLLFAVLPWGVKSQQEAGEIVPGSEPSAPVAPRLWRVAIRTTIVSAIVWLILDVLYITLYLGRDLF